MGRSLILVNPHERSPGYYSMEVLEAWGVARAVSLADLSTTTIAAMVPGDWQVSICDERILPIDFAHPAEIVGITGKVSQRDRMIELAAEFRRRGKLVVIGGPYASLNPDDMRAHADVLVRGEIEEIAGRLFGDLAAGRHEKEYIGTRPDLALSPAPRWDLYPRRIALAGQVQTSRGCPFECEFCDVIQYLGRQQRWKEPDQVVRELDKLYWLGFRDILFADDNFTVVRRRAHALLERVAAWNAERPLGRVRFSTQASIDLARDPELMQACVEAGVDTIFVGIETPNAESLAETHKRQNLRVDLADEVRKLTEAGILVSCGIITGFDSDGPDIFERQAAFIETLPVPMIMFNVLKAAITTPLHARLAKEGRLRAEDLVGLGSFLATNIVPKRMSAEALREGTVWLLNRVYAPDAYAGRVRMLVDLMPAAGGPLPAAPPFGPLEIALARRLAQRGTAERQLIALIGELKTKRPDLRAHLTYALLFYCQVRFMLDHFGIWNPPREWRAAV